MAEQLNQKIEELATEASALKAELALAEEKVKEAKAKLKEITEYKLPELIELEGYAVGSKFVMQNGRVLTVKEKFYSSIPALSTIANRIGAPAGADALDVPGLVSKRLAFLELRAEQFKQDRDDMLKATTLVDGVFALARMLKQSQADSALMCRRCYEELRDA